MVGIKDVALKANVSVATVSRVIANKPYVTSEKREIVQRAIKELNYRPNRIARSLRAKSSNIIGLIVADIQNPFFHSISRAVEDSAYKQGYSVILCNADENYDKEKSYIELLIDENACGIIISPTARATEELDWEYAKQIPMVAIDRRIDTFDFDTICINNLESAKRITKHLASHGKRRIAGLFGIGSTTGSQRRKGFISALKECSLPVDNSIIKYVNANKEDGYRVAKSILKMANPPDAMLTTNGLLAVGALQAISDSNKNIPDDIAFASFDETPWTTILKPSITVVKQPTHEIGKLATELLIQRVKKHQIPRREIILNTEIIYRHSCGC